MPSSVRVGSRPPSKRLIFSNSSGVRPCSRIISGVMAAIAEVVMSGKSYCRISINFSHVDFVWSGRPRPLPLTLMLVLTVEPDSPVAKIKVNGSGRGRPLHTTHPSILSQMKFVIVGTAGHIDHGKTALVKAVTGIDADRLEEEKRRGITMDIGFAHLQLTPGLRLGFVDVPGHERFIKNMLAGVGGIDLVLFVIAADESIKPQTREHFDICRLLEIPRGIVV